MRKLTLKQNTPEWEEFRRTHIGASDAATICGINPYKNPYKLWKEKVCGEKGFTTDAMKRGSLLEHQARNVAMDSFGIQLLPTCGLHPSIDYMMASFDGYNEKERCILEIKCPGESVFDNCANGKIPPSYIYQVQHQLEVAGFDEGYLFIYDEECAPITHKVDRNPDLIAEILEKEKDFWVRMINFEAPEDAHILREDPIWEQAALSFLQAKEAFELADAALKMSRDRLIACADNRSTKGLGVCATKVITKGGVDYKNIPELDGIDVEKYRKSARESWRIA